MCAGLHVTERLSCYTFVCSCIIPSCGNRVLTTFQDVRRRRKHFKPYEFCIKSAAKFAESDQWFIYIPANRRAHSPPPPTNAKLCRSVEIPGLLGNTVTNQHR